jgi:hypothetical protein
VTTSPVKIEKHTQSKQNKGSLSETVAFMPHSAHVLWVVFDFLFRNMSTHKHFSSLEAGVSVERLYFHTL